MGIFCDLSLKKMIEYRAVDKEKKDNYSIRFYIRAFPETVDPIGMFNKFMADWQLWPWSKWRKWGCKVVNWWVGYDGGVPLLRIDLLPSEPGSALKWSRKHRMQMEQTRKELTNSTIDRSLVRIELR